MNNRMKWTMKILLYIAIKDMVILALKPKKVGQFWCRRTFEDFAACNSKRTKTSNLERVAINP